MAYPTTNELPRPVIVITGANSGVGFGVAQRFLVQLSSPTPSDTLPTHPELTKPGEEPVATPFAAPHGCTLVLACRNAMKAHKARSQLLKVLSWLEELPDEVGAITNIPSSVLNSESNNFHGTIDEDTDPAVVAQAMEASLRRRRKRSTAVSESNSIDSVEEEKKDHDDLTRDPQTGRLYSINEREIRARGRYRRRFCAGTKIQIQAIDLGSMASALQCAKDLTARYGYVTHLVLNAGSSAFIGINWFHATWMILTSFHAALTKPKFKLQRGGDIGKDGYGWVWQANVGAHYVLVRALLPALRATPYSTPSRIIWTGSIEAYEHDYDPSDYQCRDAKKSPNPYESAKYQCELAAYGLEEILNKRSIRTEPGTPLVDDEKSYYDKQAIHKTSDGGIEPKSFLTHPGVVASSIFSECINVVLATIMLYLFYVARWTFSKHHLIDGYKGAVAATHVGLTPLSSLDPTSRYGAQCDWHGREYCNQGHMDSWSLSAPTGRGRAAKAAILNEAMAKKGKSAGYAAQPRAGDYVLALARDLIIKCEGVARNVWNQAQEGALPPFTELDDDYTDLQSPTRDFTPDNGKLFSANLLPRKTKQRT